MGLYEIRWELAGTVNGESFNVTGFGSANSDTGRHSLRLDADPGFPKGFDPSVTEFICNFPPAGFTAASSVETSLRDVVDTELFVSPSRIARIFDSAGEELVHLEALTTMRVDGNQIHVSNWLTGQAHLPAPVVHASGSEVLLPAGPHRATGTAHFGVELADGTHLDGLTVVPYRFDGDEEPSAALRKISDVTAERVGDESIVLSATSEWLPLGLLVR